MTQQPLNNNQTEEPKKEQRKNSETEETPTKQSVQNQDATVYLVTANQAQDSAVSPSMESCKLAASELQNSLKKACHFYTMLSKSTEQGQEHQEMTKVLTEAFDAVQAELNSLPCYVGSRSGSSNSSVCALGSGVGGVGEEQTLALLEQYSQLLLRAVEKRMDNKI